MPSSSSLSSNATVLVTGSDGFIAAAISWQLLKQGFKVRGTTIETSKLVPFKEKSDKEFGAGRFEIVEIPDLSIEGCLNDAVKGVEGVISCASVTNLSPDLENVVGTVTGLTQEVLSSSKASGTVKSLVTTSSRVAAFIPTEPISYKVDDSTWFDGAYELAQQSQGLWKGILTYAASKVVGEKLIWSFVEKEKPSFRVASVIPDLTIGHFFNPAPGFNPTASGFFAFADEKPGFPDPLFASPSWFVDVEDTAKLHVAALLDESTDKQRLWAASGPYSAESFQEAVRKVKPDFKAPGDISQFPGLPHHITIDNTASNALLQKHYQRGFKTLEETVKSALE